MRCIHFGSYWMGENDVVFLMGRELGHICDLIMIDTGLYSRETNDWTVQEKIPRAVRPVYWLDHDRVVKEVAEKNANAVIVNSGGMSLRPETISELRAMGVVTVGISLSDPDVYPDHGRIYSHLYDLYYTNSLFSFEKQYRRQPNIRWLPFAASTLLHRPLPGIEKKYDVVIVGHARPERFRVVEKLQQHFSVGLFGNGWGSHSHSVHGEDHVKAINSGWLYLSYSQTVAGYMNVKVGLLEAAACRVALVTQAFSEVGNFFRPGLEIALYKETHELIDIIHFYKKATRERQWLAENSYNRLLSDHTWHSRWQDVLNDIRQCKLG